MLVGVLTLKFTEEIGISAYKKSEILKSIWAPEVNIENTKRNNREDGKFWVTGNLSNWEFKEGRNIINLCLDQLEFDVK